MNFIMGFVLNCYSEMETSLRVFCQLFTRILNQAYQNNLTGVNFIFFALDHLVDIFVPELRDIFNVQFLTTDRTSLRKHVLERHDHHPLHKLLPKYGQYFTNTIPHLGRHPHCNHLLSSGKMERLL